MNLLQVVPNWVLGRSPRQLMSTSWEERDAIFEEDVNLFCWERQLPGEIIRYLEEVIPKHPPKLSLTINSATLHDQLVKARDAWGITNLPGSELFWRDVRNLTQDFLSYSETDRARLYLRVMADDGCTKFHVDGYKFRLFTTYYGSGTEWVPEVVVKRAALGTTNQKIVKDFSEVRQMQAGHVAILKGEIPNGRSRVRGIVHRSPPITDIGEKRLILRIDL